MIRRNHRTVQEDEMTTVKTDLIREIEERTLEYGGIWGMNHAKRLLSIIGRIADTAVYDGDILHFAAYMHDWGAWEPWKMAEADHARRSSEIIPPILIEAGADAETAATVADCALRHHSCDNTAAVESVLLHDADAIDFIGATGVLRNFSMRSRDLGGAFERAKFRINYAKEHLILETSRRIGRELIPRAERILAELEEESGELF